MGITCILQFFEIRVNKFSQRIPTKYSPFARVFRVVIKFLRDNRKDYTTLLKDQENVLFNTKNSTLGMKNTDLCTGQLKIECNPNFTTLR